jgi:hypothetical protein
MSHPKDVDEIENMSVEELSRHIFADFKRKPEGRRDYRGMLRGWMPQGRSTSFVEEKWEEAWFLLVDLGLIRQTPDAIARRAYDDFHLTARGKKSRYHELAFDEPNRELEKLQKRLDAPLDPVIQSYLREALNTVRDGHLLSCQFSLGVVAERVARVVAAWLKPLGCAEKLISKVSERTNAEDVIDAVIAGLKEFKGERAEFAEVTGSMLEALESLAQTYRRGRNEIAHPNPHEPPDPNEEFLRILAFNLLHTYVPQLYKLLALEI